MVRWPLLVLLAFACGPLHAACERVWMQAHFGYRLDFLGAEEADPLSAAAALQFNIECDRTLWALAWDHYRQEGLFLSVQGGDGPDDDRDPLVNVVSVMRSWGQAARFGAFTYGFGLGYARGQWGQDCRAAQSSSFFDADVCRMEHVSSLGVPVHASAVFGRWFGFGVQIRGFINTEDMGLFQLGFTIPIGRFSR